MSSKVLVVDDDSAIISVLQIALEANGYEIAVASNGKVALDVLKTFKPDVIITDIIMDEMDGLEFLFAIMNKNAGSSTQRFPCKVITISGFSDASQMNYLYAANVLGVDASIDKPFDPVVVVDAVTELLQ